MFEKLQNLDDKFEELNQKMTEPEILANPQELTKVAKARADLEPVVLAWREYSKVVEELEASKEMLGIETDSDMLDMIKAEIKGLTEHKESLEDEINILLLPKDPNDERNVIMEVRAGTGGDEAALFAADLFRMYTRYAETKGWGVDIMNSNETDDGGYKEITFMIVGKGAYSKLKF